MNFVILIVSALISLAAAANVGSPARPTVSTSAGVTAAAVPTPSPTPAPRANDVINGGGPS